MPPPLKYQNLNCPFTHMSDQTSVETRQIEDLIEYEGNPRRHSPTQVDLIVESIREYGWTVPILLDADDVVIAGHGRLAAAHQMGMEQVPTIRLEHLSEEQAKAYRIADNRLTELGEWDDQLLAQEFETLVEADADRMKKLDLQVTGFGDAEIKKALALLQPDERQADDAQIAPRANVGDLWRLGAHRLMCGDPRDAEAYEAIVDDSGVKPPSMMITTLASDMSSLWNRDINVIYAWHDPIRTAGIATSMEMAGYELRAQIVRPYAPFDEGGRYESRCQLCWYAVRSGKTARWIGDRKQATVWQADEDAPIGYMERPMRNHEGNVYDPFVGDGATIIAAERESRVCIAQELDLRLCDATITRWERYTGKTAQKAN